MPMAITSTTTDDMRGIGSRRHRQSSERRREQNRVAQKNYRDKKKRYLQRLEAIAKGQRAAPAPSTTLDDQFTGLACQSYNQAGFESVFNDISAPETLLESFPNTYSPANHQAGNEVNLSSSLAGCFQFQPATCESVNQDQWDVGLQDECPIIPSAIDPTPTVDSNHIFTRPLSNAGQNPVGMLESRLSNSQHDMQQASTQDIVQFPSTSSRLIDAQFLEDTINNKFTLQDILIAGIRALSEAEKQPMNSTPITSTSSTSTEDPGYEARRSLTPRTDLEQYSLPDIRRNTIRLGIMSFVAACIANAAMLGLSPEELTNKKSQSPFYQSQMSDEVARTTNTGQFVHLKPQLRPSTTQLAHPHHPYLDILPFPAFRNRTIQLLQVKPPPFDPEDLCRDLQSDGLICWGSTTPDGSGSVGSGAPWDIRSWEIQPWFLKKWWFLIDGAGGEMYQQTRWWCDVRGEKSSYPW